MKIILIIILVIIASCSSYRGVNRVGESSLAVHGGIKADKEWTDSLHFERRSFYIEATLMHDVLIAKLESSSPFYDWFSSLPSGCTPAYVLLTYNKQGTILSPSVITNQIEQSGYNIIVVPTFANHITSNSSFRKRNLNFYNVRALCPTENKKDIVLNLPGFKTTILEL